MNLRYFELEEFACQGTGKVEMDEAFLRKLDELRHICGFPFIITSGFRTKEHNDRIGGAPNSQHLFGRAADIQAYGANAYKIIAEAKALGFTGIGIQQKGSFNSRFIHLDTKQGAFRMWSY